MLTCRCDLLLLRLITLTCRLFQSSALLVSITAAGEGGIRDRFGFQNGDKGGCRAAAEGLVADLCGMGGDMVPSCDSAIQTLHAQVFSNYNQWAMMVGGRPVHSKSLAEAGALDGGDGAGYSAGSSATSDGSTMTDEAGGGSGVGLEAAAEENGDAPQAVTAAPEGAGPDGDTGGSPSHVGNGDGSNAAATGATPKPPPSTTSAAGAGSKKGKNNKKKQLKFGGAAVVGFGAGSADSQPGSKSTKHRHGGHHQPRGTGLAAGEADASGYLPDGSDVHTKLYELCLFYCIRAESANLRFMPE